MVLQDYAYYPKQRKKWTCSPYQSNQAKDKESSTCPQVYCTMFFGISGYRYIRTDYQEEDVIFTISGKKFSIRRPVCKSKNISKGSDALEPFGQRLRRYLNVEIEAVAIDMSAADIKAVRENLQTSVIVFDHIHVVKLLNDKLSKFRRQLFNNIDDKVQRSVTKGTRWLLLTAKENLNDEKGQVDRLQKTLEINRPLATVYYMKEDLRQVWN